MAALPLVPVPCDKKAPDRETPGLAEGLPDKAECGEQQGNNPAVWLVQLLPLASLSIWGLV